MRAAAQPVRPTNWKAAAGTGAIGLGFGSNLQPPNLFSRLTPDSPSKVHHPPKDANPNIIVVHASAITAHFSS